VPNSASISHASIERYAALFVQDDLASELFQRVTSTLIHGLDLDVSRQRLDSTHVFSDMASFGRSKLMGVAIKRFLTQLKRHHPLDHAALPAPLPERYAPSQGNLFGDFKGTRKQLRQVIAEDLLWLVNRFADRQAVTDRTSYQAMVRVLHEQCQLSEDKTTVQVKATTGAETMVNPSDPDATYDGCKGPGYQAQIAETCSPSNDAQLITAVQVEPAHCCDQDAVEPMLDQLESQSRKPQELVADTAYGSDRNVVAAEARGVNLQSPVGGKQPTEGQLTLKDFVIDPSNETVCRCPNGCRPLSSVHDEQTGRTTTWMSPSDCSACPLRPRCPVKPSRRRFVLRHTPAERRLASRRAYQATEAFGKSYAIRAGIESLNSGLKRRMGMGRLRTRGRPRVRMAVLLRCAGWNLFRALEAMAKRTRRAGAAVADVFCRFWSRWTGLPPAERLGRGPQTRSPRRSAAAPVLPAA
jgi:IS5 family transposase